jgi:transketolase
MHALTDIAAQRPEVMLLTGDLGFGVVEQFAARCPKQFLNVGVAEQNMTGLAAGLALEGHIVFTYSLGSFPTLRCLEQIRNDVCYHGANVKIVTVGGGMAYGAVGASHHATEDLAVLRAMPEMTVVAPCDLWEAAEATRAIVDYPGPVYLRLDKSAAPPSHLPGEAFELGRARMIRDGSNVTLVATGGILDEAVRAAEILEQRGISCRVLSVHTVKPLDTDALAAAARETAGIIVVEEHNIDGGLAGAVAENLLEMDASPGFFVRIGLPDCFASVVGSQRFLRRTYHVDSTSIVAAAEASVWSRRVPAMLVKTKAAGGDV